jgi:signal transduction histidine kinase/Tfp pilus assembly protein PilF
MNSIAFVYATSKPDTALMIAEHALVLSRKIKFKKGESISLRRIGNVFLNTGNYPNALENMLQSLKIAEESHDDQQMAASLGTLSTIYFYEGDMQRAIDYARKAMAVQRKLLDSAGSPTNIANLGNIYEHTNQLDSALVYTRQAYLIAVRIQNNTDLIGTTLNNLGNIFLKLGQPDSAMHFYKSSIPYYRENDDDQGFCEINLGMAKIFLQRHQPDSCLYYAKLSFTTAKNSGFMDYLLDASKFLAEYYRSVRNVDSAFVYLSATIAAKDSLFSQQKANQIQSMTYDEGVRQQQVEDARQQERARLKQNGFIAGLAALLIVAFILYRNNRQKRKANVLLQQQKEEIDGKAHELSIQKENLEQSYNNVEQLGEIGRKITSSLSVEKIISTVYNNVNALMDAAVFGIGIYNDASKRIEFPATYEDGDALPFYSSSIEDENRFAVICFKEGREIIMGNLDEEHKLYIQEVATPHEGKQPVSLIYLPLVVKENILGVITVQSFQQNAYSDYHLFMLRNIAIYTAIALENAESFETLNETVVQLRSTQSQLIQAEKMASLGELTAGIAHEIQNPLNFVNNFSEVNSELIKEMKHEIDEGNMEDVKTIADNIDENEQKILHHGKRADAIVKGMLQHSRSSSNIKEPTNINALADEYLRLSYHGLRAKDKSFNANFKTDFDESIGNINIVPQDIGRVLLNLYNNAFYAVTEKAKNPQPPSVPARAGLKGSKEYEPTVTVSTKSVKPPSGGLGVILTVKDNGNGIPQKVADKIFQPFFTTKPTGEGTGLGLSLSYDIIKAHGGEIKVETKEGEGSGFIIQLPFV